MVFDPEKRAFSGDGTSTGRLGLRIISSVVVVGGGGVCDLLSVAARGDRWLASGVAGSLSREVLQSVGLVLSIGVAGGLEYLKDLGTSMLLLTMA